MTTVSDINCFAVSSGDAAGCNSQRDLIDDFHALQKRYLQVLPSSPSGVPPFGLAAAAQSASLPRQTAACVDRLTDFLMSP